MNHTSSALVDLTVLCPTRNRPKFFERTITSLLKSLHQTPRVSATIIVIDDSTSTTSRAHNAHIVADFNSPHIIYHGPTQQDRLLKLIKRKDTYIHTYLKRFIRILGSSKWDLGGVRNYAATVCLFMTKAQGITLLLDDDVYLHSPVCKGHGLRTLIEHTMKCPQSLIGGHLRGTPDFSTIEKIIRACCAQLHIRHTFVHPLPISGGLLAFHTHWLGRFPFPRTYNEDWVWLIMCALSGGKLSQSGTTAIHQNPRIVVEPMISITREQLGEAFFEGWHWAYKNHYDQSSTRKLVKNLAYWDDIIRCEIRYLRNIKNTLTKRKFSMQCSTNSRLLLHTLSILDKTIDFISTISPTTMSDHAIRYLHEIRIWRKVARRILKSPITDIS